MKKKTRMILSLNAEKKKNRMKTMEIQIIDLANRIISDPKEKL